LLAAAGAGARPVGAARSNVVFRGGRATARAPTGRGVWGR